MPAELTLHKDPGWQRVKELALNGVTSPHSRRAYSKALDSFLGWYADRAASGFTKPR
jgi:hypothetical protein